MALLEANSLLLRLFYEFFSFIIFFLEATPEKGLELPLGKEGWLRVEAGSEICWSASGQCQNFPPTFLQVIIDLWMNYHLNHC